MRFLNTALLLVSIFMLNGCSSMRVTTKYDTSVNFKDYRTFRFVRPSRRDPRSVHNPLFNKDVMSQIRPLMEARGYSEAESMESADLLVHFYAYVLNRRDYMPPTYHFGRWGRVRHVRPGHVVHYKTGTLVIDIVDAEAKEIVWQGVGKGILNKYDPSTDLVKAVQEVLEDFPPNDR